ncbi:MAG: bile acid:sodium symporter family protein [Bacteroidales bacterium]
MYEALTAMDPATLNFSEGGLFILNITISIIMFGVALEIKPGHFRELMARPRPLLTGVLSQFILLPALTFLLIMVFWKNLTVGVAMGMILVASCPGGNVSNFISTLAKGNPALSVSLTAIATISAIFMTPLNFMLWGSLYDFLGPWSNNELLQELRIDPIAMFKIVFILLAIPIALGMLTNHFLPRFTEYAKKPIRIFSIIFFMGMLVIMFANNYDHFIQHILWILLIVFIHNAIAISSGYGLASVFKLSARNRKTVAIETGIQNSALGLVLIFNPSIFPQHLALGGMAIVVAWWGIWHILAGLSVATVWRRIS